MTTKSSRVMHMAHIMHQDKPRFPWSELVRRAWYFIRFREWLKNGICTFSFYKSDGSIREAKGTLHELLIPEDKKPGASSRQTGGAASAEKGNKAPNYQSIAFYDLEKQDWRSFNITKFIGFVTVYKLVYFSAMNEQKIDKLSCKETR